MEYKYNIAEDGTIRRVSVETELYPDNPREQYDGYLGEMFCVHPKYSLGDCTDYDDVLGLKQAMARAVGITTEEAIAYIKEHALDKGEFDPEVDEDDVFDVLNVSQIVDLSKGNLIALELWLYDHSGISISAQSFIGRAQHAEWDSGRVGVIWTTTDKAYEYLGYDSGKVSLEEIRKIAEKDLLDEVSEYDSYLCGDVFIVTEEELKEDGDAMSDDDWEEVECSAGFYCPDGAFPLNAAANEVFGKENWMDELPVAPYHAVTLTIIPGAGLSVELKENALMAPSLPAFEFLQMASGHYEITHYFKDEAEARRVADTFESLEVRVVRDRRAATLGEAKVIVNGVEIAAFGDQFGLLSEATRTMKKLSTKEIDGYVSVVPDSYYIAKVIWSKDETEYHFGELLEIRCDVDLYEKR